jgi:CHRD domain
MITRFSMNWKVSRLVMLGVLAALLLAACSTGNDPASTSKSVTASTILKHGPAGTAHLTWDPSSHTLTVQLSMTGFAPNSRHPAHIHAGDCHNAGKVVYPLQDVVAYAHGIANVGKKV